MSFWRTWLYHRDFPKGKVVAVKSTTEKPVAPPKKPRAPGRPFKKVKGGK